MPRKQIKDNPPKYLNLAEKAYNAYYGEQPQVWFDETSHDHQMRWVRSVRAVLETNTKSYGRRSMVGNTKSEPTPADDNFWQDITTMSPRKFLKMYVPKFGKTKLKFSALPADRRKAALRIKWRLQQSEKRANGSAPAA